MAAGFELDELQLDGPRLRLRPWQVEDVPRLVEALADPRVHEFVALPDPYTAADAEHFVQMARGARDSGAALESAVVEASSGRVVGSAALRFENDAEVGYWIAADATGNRYAAEATRILTDGAFALGLPRVRLGCDVRNLASARTALAAGFHFEGIARGAVTSPGGGPVAPRRGELARFSRLVEDRGEPVPYAFAPLADGGLSDGVLQLRTMRAADAPALAETDDELTLRWGFTGVAHSPGEVRRAAARAGLEWLVGGVAAFSIVDVDTGRVAGSIRLRKQGPPQVGGVGYVVHPAFRGRGYATRVLRLLVPWAFEIVDLGRLELGAKVGNDASIRAAENAGFEHDGVRASRLRNPDGTFSDEVRFALTNPRYA